MDLKGKLIVQTAIYISWCQKNYCKVSATAQLHAQSLNVREGHQSFWNTEYLGFKYEETESWGNSVEEVEDVTKDYQCKD